MRRYFATLAVFMLLLPCLVTAQVFVDTDQDGLSDIDETSLYATDPSKPDSDEDGFNDGDEVKGGFSPLFSNKKKFIEVDTDHDYLNDAWEIALGTGIKNPDSDGDKYLDGTEVAAGFDPLSSEPVGLEKQVLVDLAAQRLEYRFGDTILGAFPISGGVARLPTPKGEFTVLKKVPVKHYGGAGYDYPNTKWNLQFTSRNGVGYYIHGAYWHNDFGKPKSHGCVNVSYANMEPLYWWAQKGTSVTIK